MLPWDFNQANLSSLDLEGGEWPLVCLVYPQRPLDISPRGLAFWSKMDIFGLWVHSSQLVLQHTVELEGSVGLVLKLRISPKRIVGHRPSHTHFLQK